MSFFIRINLKNKPTPEADVKCFRQSSQPPVLCGGAAYYNLNSR